MDYSLTTYLWIFIIYAFLGWSVEVTFQAVTKGKLVNRGFLNGPVCPIYGFGMVILLYFLSPLTDNLILLFIGSVILTSILEFITGFLLEKMFDEKWWDYSEMPFNIKGYVCLSFSLMWGLGSIFVMDIINPVILKFISILDNSIGNIILLLTFVYFIADFIVTIYGILNIKERLVLLDKMAARLKLYSDDISEDIYNRVRKTIQITNKLDKKTEDILNELELEDGTLTKAQNRRKKLIERKHFVQRRLENTYPNIKNKLSKFEDEN